MKPVRIVASAILFAWLGFVTEESQAGPIVGSQVTGSFYFGTDTINVFDPANKEVPNGYLNKAGTTVTISATQTEFGYKNPFALSIPNNLYTVDFTETQIIVTDKINGSSNKFVMTFTDDAFLGATLLETSDNFANGGLTATLVGNTITIAWPSGTLSKSFFTTFSANYTIVPAPEPPVNPAPPATPPVQVAATPEPSSILAFTVAGLAGLCAIRRKLRTRASLSFFHHFQRRFLQELICDDRVEQ